MNDQDQLFIPFILQNCRDSLLKILREYEIEKHYGVDVSIAALSGQDYALAETLMANPRGILPFLDVALVKAQQMILQEPLEDRQYLTLKGNVHARVSGPTIFLDEACRGASPQISDISASHIDRLITVNGTVVRTGTVKLLEARRLYECSKCHHRFVIAADLEMGATLQLPTSCPSNKDTPCNGNSFKHCEEVALYTNFQEILLQEGRQCLAINSSSSRALTIILQDDLADTCQVGELVQVSGVLVRQFGKLYPGMRCHVGLALQATALTVARQTQPIGEILPEIRASFLDYWQSHSNRPLVARNKIVAAMCPQLCGLFSTKLASLLMLIGGSGSHGSALHAATSTASHGRGEDGVIVATERNDSSSENAGCTSKRGEIHFLLVGDPGTGKSQFQRYISLLSPRAVLTSGKSSSAAGLTAAAIKDGAHWTLEAGALVLADGGICCIDEFDAVNESDRSALHEAMEQQTCSIAKADIMTTLQTRASVFGTCNPKGHKRYNPRRPLSEQLNISGPLLSRFDIVLLLLDDMNPIWDEVVADHILDMHRSHAVRMHSRRSSSGSLFGGSSFSPCNTTNNTNTNTNNKTNTNANNNTNTTNTTTTTTTNKNIYVAAFEDDTPDEFEWTIESMKQYIAWVKSSFTPILTPPAEEILSGYYQLRRGDAKRHAARTTIRLLESLVRLSQAHARLMARRYVSVQDAVCVIALVDSSVVDGDAMLNIPSGVGLGAPGDHFCATPDEGYLELEKAVVGAVRGFHMPFQSRDLNTNF